MKLATADLFKGNRLYIVLWALLLGAVGLVLWKPWRANPPAEELSPYLVLRRNALATKPADLGLGSLGSGDVYGVVMDWDYGKGLITLVALKNGDSSLFMDNGAAFLGGLGDPAVKQAAQRLVEQSQYLWLKGERIQGSPEPLRGQVRFFFLTLGGVWSVQDKVENAQRISSTWNKSFGLANEVITQWRLSQVGKMKKAAP
jgi:hypothetical protein